MATLPVCVWWGSAGVVSAGRDLPTEHDWGVARAGDRVSLEDVSMAGMGRAFLGPTCDPSPAPGCSLHSRRVEDKQMGVKVMENVPL